MKKKHDFNSYYEELFSDRWPSLKQALLEERKYVRYEKDLLKPYFLDEASVIAAETVDVHPGEYVLDLCAAPGGKTLVLASQLRGEGVLVANERSRTRRARLIKVLEEHLPENTADMVTVTGHDAKTWGLYQKNCYDKVLLDVPCSSERHVFTSPRHFKEWSPSRTKRLAEQAAAMLLSALMTVKEGGVILYSTCALSPAENDGVIRKLLKKKGEFVKLIPVRERWGEKTDFGLHILPDTAEGRGPLYICKIRKLPDSLSS